MTSLHRGLRTRQERVQTPDQPVTAHWARGAVSGQPAE